MFKKTRYGIAILGLMLPLAMDTANASFKHCDFVKTGTPGMKASVCDLTFSAIPTFANMCILTIRSGVYTITNNAPVPIRLNYIRIKSNDAFPRVATAIVTAARNNCVVGSSLAPGASCNIQVNLVPLTTGVFNRILQVGINTRQTELDSPIRATVLPCLPPAPVPPPTPFPFPTPGFSFTILGGSTVTNTGLTAVNGNVGVSPGTAITGFPPGTVVNGTLHSNDAAAAAAQADLTTAYNNLAGLPCGTNLTGQDLGPAGGRTLTPGVYCFNSSAQLTGALTLSGSGTYVFQIGSTLTTGSGSQVLLANGASRNQVFWQVGSSATLGTTTRFQGTIAALTSITLNTGAVLQGRALARNGAVTLDTNAVNPS